MSIDYRSLLKDAYIELKALREKLAAAPRAEPLAIIGLGCRLPGAANPDAFWRLLLNGEWHAQEIPPERWDMATYYDPSAGKNGTISVKLACLLDEVDTFDAPFFGISPREARRIDPQQRLMLEIAWEALEYAGYNPLALNGSKTGVYIGVGNSDYNVMQIEPRDQIDAYVGTGSSRSITANRISYTLNLRGPSLVVDTACSSSLVALDMAAKSLRTGEIDMALVGGVNLILSPESSITFSQAQMLAADGRCKTFDAKADGYVRGEGAGAVVVKRLSDALKAGDNILAVVRGTAVNQDGRSNGLTAPNGGAQESVLRQALAEAELTPADVDYIEAHGTGTSLGDPIEMSALGRVYGSSHSAENPLYVGSVKTNIGHLEAAAGIAGLIKVALSLHHGVIPAHLHFETPSPYIAWDRLPIKVPTEPTHWPSQKTIHRAGLSSFGFGGTNSHVIVESAPAVEPHQNIEYSQYILKLSAQNDMALQEMAARYAVALNESTAPLNDIAYTANVGRTDFDQRLAVVGTNKDEIRDLLAQYARGETAPGLFSEQFDPNRSPEVVFLFTGQGAQYAGMGRELYEAEPVFRAALDQAAAILDEYLPTPLLEVLFSSDSGLIHETQYTQTALFAFEYALAQLWLSWGIRPAAMTGHSVGELVAACVAGVFSLEDALKLVAARGRLMQALPQIGGMVAVFADEATVSPLVQPYTDSVSIAAVNSPSETVISGSQEALSAITALLDVKNIRHRPLTVSHAFHSPLMDTMLEDFRQVANTITYHEPEIALVSNLTGEFVASDMVTTPDYWVRHVRGTVRFADGLQSLYDAGYRLFLEIGPRPVLAAMGQRTLPNTDAVWIPSFRPPNFELTQMLSALATLYVNGASVAWENLYNGCPTPLPTYPFQRERYWWLDGIEMSDTPAKTRRYEPRVLPAPVNRHVNGSAQKTSDGSDFVQVLAAATPKMRYDLMIDYLRTQIAQVLSMPIVKISPQHRFFDLGMDSLMAEQIKNRLQIDLDHTLSVTLVFDYPTIGKLADYLLRDILKLDDAAQRTRRTKKRDFAEPIAIVGMGCRFPGGANTPEAYWQLLINGVDAIQDVPASRWNADDYFDPDPAALGKMYVKAGGFLNQPVDEFEPLFFGISPREAASMDPQQRLLLEVTWEALENAGQAPSQLEGSRTGVFVGINTNDYQNLITAAGLDAIDATMATGNTFSAASGRISYILGLQGPSMAIDTACSSSLVSIHLAAQSLRSGECDLALAGGVNLMLSPMTTIALSKLRALSPDGRSKTFSNEADGYGRGEGAGIIVLKRLSDAQADGDTILALVRGSAVNQDGASGGLTVPNGPAQVAVIQAALTDSNFTPDAVDYVEAHGTGTILGDPIEINSIVSALSEGRSPEYPILIGSVKANIGHLEAAAGIAGVIKLVLALREHTLPSHLHFEQPNQNINWSGLPLQVLTEARVWESNGKSRIAGISSFGFSGTNAHLILEEAPAAPEIIATMERPAHLLTLSARSETALQTLVQRYHEALLKNSNISLADVAFTTNAGRDHLNYRRAFLADSVDSLVKQLENPMPFAPIQRELPPVAFLFTGQGAQSPNMLRELFETSPTFRQTVEICAGILNDHMEVPLLSVLFPDDKNDTRIHQTAYTQPTLFVVEYALAQLWLSWGIEPDALMGHSIGEYVAACLAGVFSLDDALKLVAARGRLMQALPQNGGMAALFISESDTQEILALYDNSISIAGLNSPTETVISGLQSTLDEVLADCDALGLRYQRLQVSHAFHSALMEPMLAEFEAVANTVTYSPPHSPIISNVTGQFATAEQITNAAYWAQHTRAAVRFADGLQTLHDNGARLFLEIGPRPTLTNMGQRVISDQAIRWLSSVHPRHSNWESMLTSLATLYETGFAVNWHGFNADYPRRKVALPTYPFERQRYWFEVPRKAIKTTQFDNSPSENLLGRRIRTPLKHQLYENFASANQGTIALYESRWLEMGAYVQMALEAATSDQIVTNLIMQDWLRLTDDHAQTLQTILTPGAENTTAVEITTFDSVGDNWRSLATAQLVPIRNSGDIPTLNNLQARIQQPIDAVHHSDFQWENVSVDGCFGNEGEILAKLSLLQDRQIAALFSRALSLIGDLSLIPVALESIIQYGALPEAAWCHISHEIGERLTLTIYDEQGTVILIAHGIELAPLPAHISQQAQWSTLNNWFYDIEWQQKTLQPTNTPNAHWLIFATEGDREWISIFEAQGIDAQVISPGDTYKRINSHHWQIKPSSREDMRRVLAEVEVPFDEVVYLWSAAETQTSLTIDRLMNYQQSTLTAALNLTALLPEVTTGKPHLWLVTRGVEPVAQHPIGEAGLLQAPLWGLGRVMMLEHPESWGGLIDLEAIPPTNEAEILIREINGGDGEDQIAYRENKRYVPRLMQRDLHQQTLKSYHFRTDTSYLITGGLGKLGLNVAAWMVEQGARNLILTSRQGLIQDDAKREAIRQLEAQGAIITIAAVDVTDTAHMETLFAKFGESLPPLAGIVHMAGVIQPQYIAEMSAESLYAVLQSKVQGTWVLHTLSQNLNLDFFAQFSSAAATWGSAMAGHYAAANHFQDIFAHYRHAQNLPAQAINWGWWEGGGMVTAEEQTYFEAIGLKTMPAQTALSALGHLLEQNTAQMTVAPVDWSRYKPVFEAKRTRPFLAEIRTESANENKIISTEGADLLADLAPLSADERLTRMVEYLGAIISKILRLPSTTNVDPGQGFFDLGMDSLTSVELKQTLERQFGLQLPATIAFEFATPDALAIHLISLLLGDAPVISTISAPAETTSADDDLDGLSDDELLALLASELDDGI
jgi:acyl transferase domain-containing protein/acyl carrier protein